VRAKSREKSDRHFIVGRDKEHCLSEGSQASPARPSDKGSVKVKALGWLEAVAVQGPRDFGFLN
jgi:hypothetical protein